MPDFEITQVSGDEPKSWTGDHGTFLIYEVFAKGDQGEGAFDVKRKASSPAPTVGETIDAEIVRKGDRKPELKRIWQQNAPGQTAMRGGGMTPEREKAIVRQHSQEMAIRWMTLLQLRGKIPEPTSWDWVREQIDWFQKDAEGGGAS